MLTPHPWKIESILQLLLGLFGGITFAGFYALLLGHEPAPGHLNHVMLLVGAFTVQGAGLLWLNWFFLDHQLTWWQALGIRWRTIPTSLLAGVAIGGVGFVLCSQLGMLMHDALSRFQIQPESQSTIMALQSAVSVPWVLLFAVITIVLAPIVEETIFRGILFSSIRQYGFPRIAWWGTALLFGIIHGNLMAVVPLTVLALLLNWLYVKTGSLLAPIAAHATFNAINFALTLQVGAFSAGAN